MALLFGWVGGGSDCLGLSHGMKSRWPDGLLA